MVRWLIVLSSIVIGGCADLSAVQEFAATSAQSAEYERLLDQYVDTPLREKRFQPADQQARLDEIVRARTVQRDRLLLRQELIVEYMKAIGELAADDAVEFDRGIGKIEDAVVGNGLAGDRDADAFSAVSKLLSRVVADAWRKGKLKALVTESNAPFQDVVGALRTIVGRDFTADIENEKQAMIGYYETLIRESRDSAGIAALREWEEERLSEADARARADSCYAGILGKIASGHQRLYDGRDDLGSKELVRQLKLYSTDIQGLVKAIRND